MADRPKHLVVGDPLLWTVVLYDPLSRELDADFNPTFKVYKNGTLLTDVVSVDHRELGTYDATYTPVDTVEEGDQFTVEEFATIGGTVYKLAWEFIVNAIETSGSGLRQIVGIVQDSDLEKVAGATVEVLDGGGTSLGYFDTTDTLGQFRFNLNDGDYIFLIASLPGYQTDTGTAYTVSVSQTTPLLTLNLLVDEEVPVDPDAIDLSGIRKVKTKHMEIEAWDPRIMQDVRDRELPAPTFCELEMCRGVSVRECGCNSSYRRGCY